MTATTEARIPYAHALDVAEDLRDLLDPFVVQFEIAGSIRRKSGDVKDIEIVAVPRMDSVVVDLFGGTSDTNMLDQHCDQLRARAVLTDRLDKNGRPAWGTKYKRTMYQGIPVDLFSVLPPAQWGVIMAIRTGPWLFSQSLVTQKIKGGLLPNEFFVRDGALWVKHWGDEPSIIPTPTEEDFFAAIGMPYIAPEKRGAK